MTFIASVIAKKGVAVIADSLATFSKNVVTYDQFMDYLKRKQGNANSNEISINRNELIGLFEKKPSHTTDYAEKLFQFDKFTAITLAGASQIGRKTIEHLIQELVAINEEDENYYSKTVATRVMDFCRFMEEKVRACIAVRGYIGRSILLFTHYESITEKTIIYRIVIDKAVVQGIEEREWKYVSYERISEKSYVVIEGQDNISRKILEEKSHSSLDFIPCILEEMMEDFNLPLESITPVYVGQLANKIDLKLGYKKGDSEIQQTLSKLSLQQAVNMAYLFLKLEMTFQTFIEKIPTVGGVIKIAVIDKQGFRYVTGHNILKPD
ncbi:hypothetical protein [Chitinophaga filiformis]|uniref:Uncharacterized protein n=1 Tax=Chitinophaga filiformis TaxID=104663 RepID=A0A1G7GT56_CHIFI|nr:hypothetical protein [Chitinophaga filiformis]SDE91337.1 hypothetical protein SAMN04488121_101150 [Chitinophaga filiformis]